MSRSPGIEHSAPKIVRSRVLAGEDGRAAAVAFLEDLVEVVASAGVERFETPIVESR
jgi:hypothetical protein